MQARPAAGQGPRSRYGRAASNAHNQLGSRRRAASNAHNQFASHRRAAVRSSRDSYAPSRGGLLARSGRLARSRGLTAPSRVLRRFGAAGTSQMCGALLLGGCSVSSVVRGLARSDEIIRRVGMWLGSLGRGVLGMGRWCAGGERFVAVAVGVWAGLRLSRVVAGSRRPSLSRPPAGGRCSESLDLPGIRAARGLTRVSHGQLGAHLASWFGVVVVRVVFYGYSKVWNRGAPFVFERRSTTRLL